MTKGQCKVCRIIGERNMEDYEPRMVEQWKGSRGERKGYRQLADWFNEVLLQREMDKAGLSTLGDEAKSKYERLQDDGTVAEELRMTLRTDGVPIDAIESDFVSYGVIRTHLRECLGEEYEVETEGDWELEAIERTKAHATEKISEAVQAAVSKGKIESRDKVSVNVSVELECNETHVSVPVERAMRRGYVSTPDGGETR